MQALQTFLLGFLVIYRMSNTYKICYTIRGIKTFKLWCGILGRRYVYNQNNIIDLSADI